MKKKVSKKVIKKTVKKIKSKAKPAKKKSKITSSPKKAVRIKKPRIRVMPKPVFSTAEIQSIPEHKPHSENGSGINNL